MNGRLIKIIFTCSVGLYILLVCFNNITDYHSNLLFVSKVATMEDTFSKETNAWRSINPPFLHHLLFVLIVLWEIGIAGLLVSGAAKMIRRLKAPAPEFAKAKRNALLGLALGVLLWFTVFIGIGGEWFLMWQSKNWNAQPTAFFLTTCFLLFLIYLNQEDSF